MSLVYLYLVNECGECLRKGEVCGIMCFVQNMERRGHLCVGRGGGFSVAATLPSHSNGGWFVRWQVAFR